MRHENSYVTLVGRAKIVDDVEVKKAIWNPASYQWHPGGSTDPNVVLIDFRCRSDRALEFDARRHAGSERSLGGCGQPGA